jgi:CO/xanthine dehydrogenase Mo-binding subunit
MDQFHLPDSIQWNQKTFVGDSYPSYSWGSNVVELEIDPLTCEIFVRHVTGVYDIGRVINPVLASGQIEGGLTQALGYALMEKMAINKKGLYDADRMQTYVVPTMRDVPVFDVKFLEFPYGHAAPGAKGVGEIPMDGLGPAIANAVEAATGIRIRDLPITPEKIFDRKERKGTQR